MKDISAFKREHDLAPGEEAAAADTDLFGPRVEEEEPDLRAEDEAAVAAALEAEAEEPETEDPDSADDPEDGSGDESDEDKAPSRRRRGRRGGRGRGSRQRKPLEGTFDHGEEGYGLWLDPSVQDDPVYAEHWAGHRTVSVTVEAERIVIARSGDSSDD